MKCHVSFNVVCGVLHSEGMCGMFHSNDNKLMSVVILDTGMVRVQMV